MSPSLLPSSSSNSLRTATLHYGNLRMLLLLLLFLPPRKLFHPIHLIVMLLTHPSQNTLLRTSLHAAKLFLRSVRNAPSSLYRDLLAPVHLASLARRTVRAAQSHLFDVFGTSRVGTDLAFGSVGDAQASLYDAIGTVGDGALASGSFLFGGGLADVEGRR